MRFSIKKAAKGMRKNGGVEMICQACAAPLKTLCSAKPSEALGSVKAPVW